MAASLVVPTEKVFQHAYRLTRCDLPPMDELARMAGEPASTFELPLMLRKAAIKLLGELVVDAGSPELAEHIQAMRGIRDARLHGYAFDLKTMRKYRRDLVKHHGTVQLERALA